MLSIDYIKELLGMQEVIVKSAEENGGSKGISIETERKVCVCPVCGFAASGDAVAKIKTL